VFNWSRLVSLAAFALLATVGIYLVTIAGRLIVLGASADERDIPNALFGRFNRVVQTWARRELLLKDDYWLRNAYIEAGPLPGYAGPSRRDAHRPGRDAATLHVARFPLRHP